MGCYFSFKEGEEYCIFIFEYRRMTRLWKEGGQKWKRGLRGQETIQYKTFYVIFVLNHILLPVKIHLNK